MQIQIKTYAFIFNRVQYINNNNKNFRREVQPVSLKSACVQFKVKTISVPVIRGRVLCPSEPGNDVFKTITVAVRFGDLKLNLATAFCVGGRQMATGPLKLRYSLIRLLLLYGFYFSFSVSTTNLNILFMECKYCTL